MRILVLTPFLPSPTAAAGFPRAAYSRLSLLASDHSLTLLSLYEPEEVTGLRRLRELGIEVQLFRRDSLKWGAFSTARKRLNLLWGLLAGRSPMLVQEFYSKQFGQALTRELAEGYDLLLAEHTLVAQYLEQVPAGNGPAIIFSEHDVRLALPAQDPGEDPGAGAPLRTAIQKIDRGKWARYELRACLRANITLVPTAEDKLILKRAVPGANVRVVPFSMPNMQETANSRAPRERATLLFVGNFMHEPNVDAAVRLANSIFPLVKAKYPDATLQIVGKAPGAEVRALRREGVVVTGEVPSVAPYLQRCTVFVAPLRKGGGTRMKVLEAMQYGTPVITTALGAQGTGAAHGEELLVAESDREIAQAIMQVLDNPNLGETLGAGARKSVHERESVTETRAQLNRVIREAVGMSGKATI